MPTGMYKRTEEMNKRMSDACKGRKHSKETKEKMSKSHLGIKHTEETKRLLSQKHKGKRISPNTEYKKGQEPWNKSKTWMTDEIKEKMLSSRIQNFTEKYGLKPEDYEYLKKLKRSYNVYKHCAKKRGISWDLTVDVFSKYWRKNCHYCGNKIKTIGIDRIDSFLGYIPDNIVPCCKICNQMKSNMGLNKFYNHIAKILKQAIKGRQYP